MPRFTIFATPADVRIKYENVDLTSSDGTRINGWFVPTTDAQYTVLFCHGNGGCLAHRVDVVEQFHNMGINFFIFDYRGYGASGGKISEPGFYQDAIAAWDYLRHDKSIPAEQIFIVGRSMGGAVAAHLAAARTPAGLALENAFLSLPEAGQDHYPFFPVRQLSRYRFPTKKFILEVNCPTLLICSVDDKIVNVRHSRRLFELAPGDKSIIELRGSHNDCYFQCDAQYTAALKSFFTG